MTEKAIIQNDKKSIILLLAKVICIFITLYIFFLKAKFYSLNVPTFHLDGAFQTASALFRLSSGETIGKDFFPYLGIGPNFLLYPIFKLLGSNLGSSVMSSFFMTYFSGWISFSVLVFLCLRCKNFLNATIIGSILFITSELFGLTFFNGPGNSLKPIRAFIPYIIAISTYLIIHTNISTRNKIRCSGAVLGISLIWSNDYAIPTALVSIIFFLLYFHLSKKEKILKTFFSLSFYCLISYFILGMLSTKGNLFNLIQYNFSSVAKDQGWYFASYTEAFRVYSFSSFIDLIILTNYKTILSGIVIFAYALHTMYKFHSYRILINCTIGIICFSAGALSSIAGHYEDSYFVPFNIWAYLSLSLLILDFCLQQIHLNKRLAKYTQIIINLVVFIILLLKLYEYLLALDYQEKSFPKNDNYKYIQEFNGFLNSELIPYLDFIEKNKNKPIIEEYWGLWSAYTRKKSLWPVDSVIHALGSVKNITRKEMDNDISYIVTTRLRSRWVPWNLSLNYWFYGVLLKSWHPEHLFPTTIVWTKREEPITLEEYPCDINEQKNAFSILSANEGLYEVRIEYDYNKSKIAFPSLITLKDNINIVFGSFGYRPISPYEKEMVLPVYIQKGQNAYFDTKVVGSINSFSFISCKAYKLNLPNFDFYKDLFLLP